MRPVDRGAWPLRDDGTPHVFAEYDEARGALFDRIGEYCSFCERKINSSLAVEHVLSKHHHPTLERDWNNFLLACVNCNSTKGHANVQLTDYFWPDRDNTARAVLHGAAGIVKPAPGLNPADAKRAQSTIVLVGLDKLPHKKPRRSDRRWQHRKEAWEVAQVARARIAQNDTPHMRDLTVALALEKGHWSIWMTVFADDRDMRQRLIAAFTGTATACFDAATQPVPRAGGAL
ncbi:HNH endonuclease [Corallococcus carmarthensis]|uniref:HNH endonuclease n=1 Tax=Corallococcus carmarthensis TaxID=2316728 RepID=A0A3A8JWT1_9BACT|nr:HNH endonuclease [Corallococcus carmarthensis]